MLFNCKSSRLFCRVLIAAFAVIIAQDASTCGPVKLGLLTAQLGSIIDIGNVNNMTTFDMLRIRQSLLQHGVIVIRGQNLTRKQQVEFTSRFGKTVVLPPSLEGKDPEKGFPEIQRVTNYWANGTWKRKEHAFGCYWHKDGNFQQNGYMASILYAEELTERAAPTMFLDNCQLSLTPTTLSTLYQAVFSVSVRDIPDFAAGSEEDLALFPKVKLHPGIYNHPENGRRCAYVTNTLITHNVMDYKLTTAAWEEVIDRSKKYVHNWLSGDIVVWDNLAVMHRAACVSNNSLSGNDTSPRLLFRTQAFLV